jgi:enamine deaminase RidA (YjgF/YER057c/UK114 family)
MARAHMPMFTASWGRTRMTVGPPPSGGRVLSVPAPTMAAGYTTAALDTIIVTGKKSPAPGSEPPLMAGNRTSPNTTVHALIAQDLRRRHEPCTTIPIRRLNPPDLGPPPGYSQVVEVQAGRIFFIAGQTALDAGGALVGKDDFAAQADQVFRNLAVALEAVGCTAANLVKLTVFLRDMDNLRAYREARNRFFATVSPPAAPVVTLVEVSKLYGPEFLIEIEAVAAA